MVSCLHPTRPRYPIHCVIYTFSFTQWLHASPPLSHKRLSPPGGPRKAPGQDLAQNGCFPMIPEGIFNCKAPPPDSQNLASKGSWPGFGSKGLFPNDSEGIFHCRALPPESQKSGSKRFLARIWLKRAVSQ